MYASTIDFVTALSAEAQCALCDEPHAVVDQRRCAMCGATTCPDCASSRTQGGAWRCSSCRRARDVGAQYAKLEREARLWVRRAGVSARQQAARAASAANAQAAGFVLGTAILVAVARADDGRDPLLR